MTHEKRGFAYGRLQPRHARNAAQRLRAGWSAIFGSLFQSIMDDKAPGKPQKKTRSSGRVC
jgi:hypothetical protein